MSVRVKLHTNNPKETRLGSLSTVSLCRRCNAADDDVMTGDVFKELVNPQQ